MHKAYTPPTTASLALLCVAWLDNNGAGTKPINKHICTGTPPTRTHALLSACRVKQNIHLPCKKQYKAMCHVQQSAKARVTINIQGE